MSTLDSSPPPPLPRTISHALQLARAREESENLLGEEEETLADRSGCITLSGAGLMHNPNGDLPVYKNIHRIRRLVTASIEDPYSFDQLMSPSLNISIIRPLTDRLFDPDDISIVYCLLVNRMRFLKDQIFQAHHHTTNLTRAILCEILAARVLRRFNEVNASRKGLLMLANILVAPFEPFQNCPEEILRDNRDLLHRKAHLTPDKTTNALEVAILSESKIFLASSACQRVVDSLYRGRIVYTPNSLADIIPDHYKKKGITLYDPRKAPILNHYRLIVPRTRTILEFLHFVVLVLLYVCTMIYRDGSVVTGWEIAFQVYAAGWMLDEFASMLEHGWFVHTQNLWSFLDISLFVLFFSYFVIRAHSWALNNPGIGVQALDVLACGAPIMLTRVAFNVMPENLLFISLRAMMSDFILLTIVASWCFAGFLFSMTWLSRWRGSTEEPIPALLTSKWMLWIWFGLDGTGITRAVDFHMILGPILMVTFAFMGNTLFLTILVSMLTNTFSKIAANSTAEIQFRRAVLTFEGVKSDAIFAYRPPTNLLAVLILVPLRFIISPRWFHKIHVFAVRVLNAPILLLIGFYEREHLWDHKRSHTHQSLTRGSNSSRSWFRGGFTAHRDLTDVFELNPPQSMADEIEEEDALDEEEWEAGIYGLGNNANSSRDDSRRRRLSAAVPRIY